MTLISNSCNGNITDRTLIIWLLNQPESSLSAYYFHTINMVQCYHRCKFLFDWTDVISLQYMLKMNKKVLKIFIVYAIYLLKVHYSFSLLVSVLNPYKVSLNGIHIQMNFPSHFHSNIFHKYQNYRQV